MAANLPSSRDASPQPRRPASSAGHATTTKRGGLLLGRYELGCLLGHGTFAKVYHARHADTGEIVAIKVLDKERALRNGLVPHIKCEIAILRRVRHLNIVRLFEVMATKSKIYFVMEFVLGRLRAVRGWDTTGDGDGLAQAQAAA